MGRHRHEEGRGPSQRQLRVAEVIRHALSDALMRGETHEPELEGVSVTVSEVRTSPDLKQATAYVMPLGGERVEETLAALHRARGELRRIVGRTTGLKFTPDLRFHADDSFDRMDDTRRMLSEDRVRADIDRDAD